MKSLVAVVAVLYCVVAMETAVEDTDSDMLVKNL